MNSYSDLERVISNSDLSSIEKEDFVTFLMNAKKEDVDEMIELFEEFPESIGIVYRFAQQKSEAALRQDAKAFKEIIKEEIAFLEKV
jgi:hypothetical protein